jgi:hypothetical protein
MKGLDPEQSCHQTRNIEYWHRRDKGRDDGSQNNCSSKRILPQLQSSGTTNPYQMKTLDFDRVLSHRHRLHWGSEEAARHIQANLLVAQHELLSIVSFE